MRATTTPTWTVNEITKRAKGLGLIYLYGCPGEVGQPLANPPMLSPFYMRCMDGARAVDCAGSLACQIPALRRSSRLKGWIVVDRVPRDMAWREYITVLEEVSVKALCRIWLVDNTLPLTLAQAPLLKKSMLAFNVSQEGIWTPVRDLRNRMEGAVKVVF